MTLTSPQLALSGPSGPSRHPAVVRTGTGPGGLGLRHVDPPVPAAQEVLLEVELCGLCGSDLHLWKGDDGYGWVPTGTVIGHEIVGRIASVPGAGAHDGAWGPGQLVVPIAQGGCGHCAACLDDYANGCPDKTTLGLSRRGGAARWAAVDAGRILAVPEGVPALTAVLTEPLSVAARAVVRTLERLRANGRGAAATGRIFVSGPGTIGLLAAVVCRHLGVDVVLLGTAADVAARQPLAARLGIPLVDTLPAGAGPSAWIEAAGAQAALAAAVDALPVRGTLTLVALYGTPPAVDATAAVRKELDVVTSYSSHRADYALALEVLAAHPGLGEDLVEAVPLDDVAGAFALMGRGARPKVALAV